MPYLNLDDLQPFDRGVTMSDLIKGYAVQTRIMRENPNCTMIGHACAVHTRAMMDSIEDVQRPILAEHNQAITNLGRRHTVLTKEGNAAVWFQHRDGHIWRDVLTKRQDAITIVMPEGYHPGWRRGACDLVWLVYEGLMYENVFSLGIGESLPLGIRYVLVNDEAATMADTLDRDADRDGFPGDRSKLL